MDGIASQPGSPAAASSPTTNRLDSKAEAAMDSNDIEMDFDDETPLTFKPKEEQIPALPSSPPKKQAELSSGIDMDFNQLLAIFYDCIFPFREFYRWLHYGGVQKNYFLHRELSFTLSNDAYLRFKSFKDGDEMKAEILKLCPIKIDIGAVYNSEPKKRATVKDGAFKPIERELVFDIDMTDYDPIRSCCSGADICRKCWDFMTVSIKIIDRALQDDFGFKHRLWVYSGRRGVHCWVCDDRARKLTAESRRAIVNYLEVVKGGEETTRKVNLSSKGLHPSLRKANEILNPVFTQRIMNNQDILTNPEKWKNVIALIPDDDTRKRLSESWSKSNVTPAVKWGNILAEIKALSKKKPSAATAVMEIIFQHSYPRLDSNVSVGLNHLLKSPFCVHPKTGRVCIPIDPKKADSFDPFQAPKVSDLVEQIADFDLSNPESARTVPHYQKTSMKAHVEYFRKFVEELEEEAKEVFRARRAEEDKKLQF
ncbi:primase, DNA, polypeptide 1 (49kDa) [Chytriomyces hyalinus]|nr:primase, DNA, polypeptide 1 (49kDa) [Chytriomyces hyalinus]